MSIVKPQLDQIQDVVRGFIHLEWSSFFNLIASKLNQFTSMRGEAGELQLPSFSKTAMPPPSGTSGRMIFVTDEIGGPVPAFSDGTFWRRVTDRAVVG